MPDVQCKGQSSYDSHYSLILPLDFSRPHPRTCAPARVSLSSPIWASVFFMSTVWKPRDNPMDFKWPSQPIGSLQILIVSSAVFCFLLTCLCGSFLLPWAVLLTTALSLFSEGILLLGFEFIGFSYDLLVLVGFKNTNSVVYMVGAIDCVSCSQISISYNWFQFSAKTFDFAFYHLDKLNIKYMHNIFSFQNT